VVKLEIAQVCSTADPPGDVRPDRLGSKLMELLPSNPATKPLTQVVERKTVPTTITANGTVKAYRSINLSPKTAGVVKSLLVKEGDRVRQGQTVALMDDSSLRGQLTQYQGQLLQQQANLQRLQAGNRPQDIAKAEAQLAEVKANLQQLQAGNRTQGHQSSDWGRRLRLHYGSIWVG
jgi:HlyD family secretion protein